MLMIESSPLFPGNQRLPREPEVHLVPGVGNLRPGTLRAAEGAQGDVGSAHQAQQDHPLRTGVRKERRKGEGGRQRLKGVYVLRFSS